MDRRTVSATLFTAILGGGGAAVIGAAALQTGSPYFDTLIYGGVAAIVVGVLGLFWLFIFQPKEHRMEKDEKPQKDRPKGPIGVLLGENSQGNVISNCEFIDINGVVTTGNASDNRVEDSRFGTSKEPKR